MLLNGTISVTFTFLVLQRVTYIKLFIISKERTTSEVVHLITVLTYKGVEDRRAGVPSMFLTTCAILPIEVLPERKDMKL